MLNLKTLALLLLMQKNTQIHNNYLLTYDSYVPLYNRFHRGEWITRVSGGEGALDTPGPLNGTSEASAIWAQECTEAASIGTDSRLYWYRGVTVLLPGWVIWK